MRAQNEQIGMQLHVASATPGLNESPAIPGRDPTALGIGPAAIPGSIYANGCVLIGNPLAFPAIAEATCMIAPANALVNPMAFKTPSILKVTNRLTRPPTPIDVWFGDPAGLVGVTMNTATINITETVAINIATPTINITGVKNQAGAQNDVGAQTETGPQVQSGTKVISGASKDNGKRSTTVLRADKIICPNISGRINVQSWKKFDIPHPNKKGYRLTHVCVEGPEAAVYIRGRLNNTHIIDLPDYWQGLVDYDTITVSLTPYGKPDLSLYVKEIKEDKIILSSDHLTQVQCFYDVWVNRIGPELHVEYEGESPADYPGDDSLHSIAGYHYDVRED